MARKLDQILVVDIEATCWPGTPPDGQESEVIEIGLCTLDVTSGERIDKRSILVKPERSKISEFCTELTSLTPKQVSKEGISFKRACGLLETEYLSKKRVWASYGEYDRALLERQCAARGVDYPFSAGHINVKILFGLIHALPYEVGMARAMQMCGLDLEGRHHRGVDDAWNIALLLSSMILKRDNERL